MKALVFEKYGGPEVLEWKDVPDPEPGPNDAVVEVKAAAVNYNDIWGRRGAPQEVPLPHISGSDAAGIVTQIGDAVTDVKIGDEVVVHCGRPARGTKEGEGQQYSIWAVSYTHLTLPPNREV